MVITMVMDSAHRELRSRGMIVAEDPQPRHRSHEWRRPCWFVVMASMIK